MIMINIVGIIITNSKVFWPNVSLISCLVELIIQLFMLREEYSIVVFEILETNCILWIIIRTQVFIYQFFCVFFIAIRYGDVFRTHILGKAIIVSTDPSVNKLILQNHGSAFIPSYPKSIIELLGKSSILQTNGALHKKVHALIGVFLKSPQLKARITRDIEKVVLLSLSTWMDKGRQIYVQDETKKV